MDLSVDGIAALFARRPWRDVTEAMLAPALRVPSMLGSEEQKLYLWLARDWANGAGEIVDLGSFVGGSTARLAEGVRLAGRDVLVHAYDQFTADETVKQRYLYSAGVPPFEGPDMLHVAHDLLSPWDRRVTFYVGDILRRGWNGDPIEIMAIDASKTDRLTDHTARTFFPSLIPGRSVIIQQDFLHTLQPWLPAQMAMYGDYFRPLIHCPRDCVVYLCTRRITPEDTLDRCISGRSDEDLTVLIRKSARLLKDHVGRYRFARQIRALRASPGIRVSWQMSRNPQVAVDGTKKGDS